jgi:hypothetical protein
MADNQFINFNSQDVADMYRRNQYARMLQEQAAAPIERASYKGIEADIHPMQGVAKLTAALLAGYQQNRMDKSYAKEKADAEQKMAAEQERSQNEFKEYGEQYNDKVSQGYSPDYVNSPSNYGTPQTVSTPLSPQQRLAVAMKNRMNPNERIASDARAEIEQGNTIAQNEARAAEKAITEATRQRERKEDIDTRASEFKALRAEAAAKSNAPAKEKSLPTPVAQKLLENQNNLYNVRKALALTQGHTVDDVEGDASATGYKGFLPNAVLQRVDPQGVATRAEIANIGSMIIHDRSGAAVTAAETPRLMPFIPTATDDDDAVQTKLKRFVNEYERIQNETKDYFTESGFKVPNLASAMPKIKYKEDSAAKKGATNDFDALVEKFRTKVK